MFNSCDYPSSPRCGIDISNHARPCISVCVPFPNDANGFRNGLGMSASHFASGGGSVPSSMYCFSNFEIQADLWGWAACCRMSMRLREFSMDVSGTHTAIVQHQQARARKLPMHFLRRDKRRDWIRDGADEQNRHFLAVQLRHTWGQSAYMFPTIMKCYTHHRMSDS
jgi:hypothetical protein